MLSFVKLSKGVIILCDIVIILFVLKNVIISISFENIASPSEEDTYTSKKTLWAQTS